MSKSVFFSMPLSGVGARERLFILELENSRSYFPFLSDTMDRIQFKTFFISSSVRDSETLNSSFRRGTGEVSVCNTSMLLRSELLRSDSFKPDGVHLIF